jgi:methylenetetrahydrofolate--tRNA-(uracil-5-)-methyltransferase
MNVNFGLFPPIDKTQLKKPEGQKRWRGKEKQTAKKRVYSARALEHFKQWLDGQETLQAAE